MRCNNCGANLEAGATVCPECNTPVQNGELAQLNKKINGLKIALVADSWRGGSRKRMVTGIPSRAS